MRPDMMTIHAMFDGRDDILRTVSFLPDGAVAVTESDDETLAALIKDHVPNMDSRVLKNQPLPPMTFHPVFQELITHAGDYSLDYEETDKGVKVTYQSDDPYVVMLVQEHAKLVSRFIKNGEDRSVPEAVRATERGDAGGGASGCDYRLQPGGSGDCPNCG
jgi:hypothetical protein